MIPILRYQENTGLYVREVYATCGHKMRAAIECDGRTQSMLQDASDFSFKHIFTLTETQDDQCDYY